MNINVGGSVFTCWKYLLTNQNCLFKTIFKQKNKSKKILFDKEGNLFFDRSPLIFEFILNLLRQRKYNIKVQYDQKIAGFTVKQVIKEIEFFGFSKILKIEILRQKKKIENNNKYFQIILFNSLNYFGNLFDYNFYKKNFEEINQFFFSSAVCLFYIFWFLKTLLMINLITNSSYIVFYPIYAMTICITALMILNAIVETGSRFPYLILFTIAAIFMLYLSFFFKKFHHHINEIEYYKWTTISFPILMIGVLILISNGIYVINNLLNGRKYTTEDWIQEFFPFVSWYTLLTTTSYLDDLYFKSFWWVFGPYIVYCVFGFMIYCYWVKYLPFSQNASKNDTRFGMNAFIGLGSVFYLLNHWLDYLPRFLAFLPLDSLIFGFLYFVWKKRI